MDPDLRTVAGKLFITRCKDNETGGRTRGPVGNDRRYLRLLHNRCQLNGLEEISTRRIEAHSGNNAVRFVGGTDDRAQALRISVYEKECIQSFQITRKSSQ